MTFLVCAPGVEIITLTRDMTLTREFEVNYLNEHGFKADFAKLKYSYNVGLWGTSICGGEILDSKQGLPDSAYLKQVEKEGEEDNDCVTLMTIHSAKGLEYEYVYVVGVEENIFPSSRALETVEGIEEERRLFYVALTRAKRLATLSCADMRFKWGSMEFSTPSRFLAEIDEQFVESDIDFKKSRAQQRKERGEEGSAVDVLRRRFDVRHQQRTENGQRRTNGFDRTPVSRPQTAPQRDVTGMRRVASSTIGQVTTEACAYSVGERVEHPKFGRGEVIRIEPLATDHKLVVRFASGEEKTLLAKLAKLTKLG